MLFSLASEDPAKQLLYYQVGIGQRIGTHESPLAPAKVFERITATVDEAIGFSLGQHICGGYRFLMEHWTPGDEIFLFGFSRGAYTARALAGMLQQVGLLPAGNHDTIPLAFSIFKRKAGTELVPGRETLAEGFKRTFSRDVDVRFVGVFVRCSLGPFRTHSRARLADLAPSPCHSSYSARSQDTVASVGAVIPRTLPFAFGASYIRTFRHALALDEARARYYPQPWISEDALANEPEDSLPTDVKEVWFSGAHSNVGGGEFAYDGGRTPALAHLSLRWMLREAVEAGFEVDPERVAVSPLFAPFVERARRALDARERDEALEEFLKRAKANNQELDELMAAVVFLAARPSPEATAAALSPRANHVSFRLEKRPPDERKRRGWKGRVADWWDRVQTRAMTAFWWLLELSPTVKVFWDIEGNSRKWSIRCVAVLLSSLSPPSLALTDSPLFALIPVARTTGAGGNSRRRRRSTSRSASASLPSVRRRLGRATTRTTPRASATRSRRALPRAKASRMSSSSSRPSRGAGLKPRSSGARRERGRGSACRALRSSGRGVG